MVKIADVEKNSLAQMKNICAGGVLLSINGNAINDVLDYRFYIQDDVLDLALRDADGRYRLLRIHKDEFADIGLIFDSYLMDKQRSCGNKCLFCFIDQMPRGLRQSLYFKDDDARLSFLFGNYVTLTNLSAVDVERICKMHISPVNVSVHTMNPALRVRMMGNPKAGEVLGYLGDFATAGIRLNLQLVLCPGINDGNELVYSLREIAKLGESVQSVALVPVGLTKHREGLPHIESYKPENSCEILRIVEEFNADFPEALAFCADEFYLNAGAPFPPVEHYGELHQLENGVGMCALFRHEFMTALNEVGKPARVAPCTVVTGVAAYPLISELCGMLSENIRVVAVENKFFGGGVTVAGLLCGQDVIDALRARDLGERVILPGGMFNTDTLTLDGKTREEISQKLGVYVNVTKSLHDVY
ncbi:MAG: DUF512 domain-containing protein [Oscillospiraceae bacterium]|nr:DUF512 domain-containing protein [Oscillospiraceae bacterium]